MKEKASESNEWLFFGNDDDVTREEAQNAMREFGIHSPEDCENDPHCSEDPDRTECCGVCETYIQKILDELKTPHDDDFDYYVPYIESVKNHWYRDVYFSLFSIISMTCKNLSSFLLSRTQNCSEIELYSLAS